MDDVLDGHANRGQRPRQLGDAARPVAHSHRELDQAAVGGQAAVEAAPEDRGVDVAAAERDDNSEIWVLNKFMCFLR